MTEPRSTNLDLSHLRREVRTALELAILGLANADLVDRLAVVAGLIEAIETLPPDCTPLRVLLPKVLERARFALDGWKQWQGLQTKGNA